jgi:hypothetical protein
VSFLAAFHDNDGITIMAKGGCISYDKPFFRDNWQNKFDIVKKD